TGKHTACGEQHVLTTHTAVFDAQVKPLHGSSTEHNTPGAQ
ncbi:unnamed protein product, partial [Rotaria sp. Silwood2]